MRINNRGQEETSALLDGGVAEIVLDRGNLPAVWKLSNKPGSFFWHSMGGEVKAIVTSEPPNRVRSFSVMDDKELLRIGGGALLDSRKKAAIEEGGFAWLSFIAENGNYIYELSNREGLYMTDLGKGGEVSAFDGSVPGGGVMKFSRVTRESLERILFDV